MVGRQFGDVKMAIRGKVTAWVQEDCEFRPNDHDAKTQLIDVPPLKVAIYTLPKSLSVTTFFPILGFLT